MNIMYGDGNVKFEGSAKSFSIIYKGKINIINETDGLLISANKNRIIGIMLNGQDLPELIFRYKGLFQIIIAQFTDGIENKNATINTIGIDNWEIDKTNWDDDTSFWDDNKSLLNNKSRTYQFSGIVDKQNTVLNDKYADAKKQSNGKITENTKRIIKSQSS